jgi:hypothetical protein
MGDSRGLRPFDYCCYSVNDLVLSRSSSNGWNDGAKKTNIWMYPSRSNKSANKRTKQPNRTYRKFPFALIECVLPSLMAFRSF